jgi:hypothetical protein
MPVHPLAAVQFDVFGLSAPNVYSVCLLFEETNACEPATVASCGIDAGAPGAFVGADVGAAVGAAVGGTGAPPVPPVPPLLPLLPHAAIVSTAIAATAEKKERFTEFSTSGSMCDPKIGSIHE